MHRTANAADGVIRIEMRTLNAIMFGFLVVGLGYVCFSFTPFLFNIVFWPQTFAASLGVDAWQKWPVVLELIVPAFGWALIFLLLAALLRRLKSAVR